VQERKPGSHGKWNLPGGHLELGERLVAGAEREVREELGQDLSVTGLLGVYTGLGAHHFLNLVFTARTDNDGQGSPTGEVLARRWFRTHELFDLPDRLVLNPRKLRRILDDYQTREPHDLDCIGEMLYGDRAIGRAST